MHQCGLRPPAVKASLPVFDEVLADIGDEQSIAMSLSTFSGHIRNLTQILARSGERSLVLLDEVAAGTDPHEGAALARALLERLVERGALVMATTHYPELKEWASATEGVVNAAVGFDPETLAPTYRVTLGRPGASHALQIAERLGLGDGVPERARARMAPERLHVVRAAGRGGRSRARRGRGAARARGWRAAGGGGAGRRAAARARAARRAGGRPGAARRPSASARGPRRSASSATTGASSTRCAPRSARPAGRSRSAAARLPRRPTRRCARATAASIAPSRHAHGARRSGGGADRAAGADHAAARRRRPGDCAGARRARHDHRDQRRRGRGARRQASICVPLARLQPDPRGGVTRDVQSARCRSRSRAASRSSSRSTSAAARRTRRARRCAGTSTRRTCRARRGRDRPRPRHRRRPQGGARGARAHPLVASTTSVSADGATIAKLERAKSGNRRVARPHR